jgi:hypothetical protein
MVSGQPDLLEIKGIRANGIVAAWLCAVEHGRQKWSAQTLLVDHVSDDNR